MNKYDFKSLLEEGLLILDGATGTELQKRGMPVGVCPEKWVIENPQTIIGMQQEYIDAGSKAVYSCTFGGNRLKLAEYGLGAAVFDFNRQLALLSRQAVENRALVAGDISSTGQFVQPFGDLPFEEGVNIFKEQVAGLLAGGVDFFIIETMIDIQEARAALLAVKESCDLPVCVSMTFDEDGRTLTGSDPLTALVTLQSLGADAVGCNCSTGPEAMTRVIAAMKPYAKVPLLAKPNAGLPKLVEGRTIFDMSPETFSSLAGPLVEAGANLIGGCCGTSPVYIRALNGKLAGMKFQKLPVSNESMLCSARKTVFVGPQYPVTIVGERINPTGKKVLQAELREGKLGEVRRLAMDQVESGASILDVNVGMSGIDERLTMVKVVEVLATTADAPLCLDSSSPEVIEAALRIYPGRALINSISAEKIKLERLLPVAAKYGAMFVLLPLGDKGIPVTAEKRVEVVESVFQQAVQYGYSRYDLVIDGLVMTVSADQGAASETLKVIEWAAMNGFNSIMGLSNVSFGLPERVWINAAFLAMSIAKGLTMAIANPALEVLVNLKMASDVLMFKDKNSNNYLNYFAKRKKIEEVKSEIKSSLTAAEMLRQAVINGQIEQIGPLIEKVLAEGGQASNLMTEQLIPAINYVGDLFEKKQYFLPQLIQSAEAMKAAFIFLEPYLKSNSESLEAEDKIVLATVKGDIHDIGKNIVALMLRNYGFKVYDLGKDVSAEIIVAKVKETKAQLVGLSALMTTTMSEMKHVIECAKVEGLRCKFMIGGAAVDQEYADSIGADGYSSDAHHAVKLAQKLIGEGV